MSKMEYTVTQGNGAKYMNVLPVNERIKEVRTSVGITQAKFAERIAISASYLAEIEHNNKPASERIIRLLIAEYNVNDLWLRTGEGSMFNDGMDVQTIKVISLFKSLNQQFKACAINQLGELADLHSQIINS